jgi:hypothetical protein
VDARELAVALEVAQVTPYGHLGDPEGDGQLADVGRAVADGLEDLLSALRREHRRRSI